MSPSIMCAFADVLFGIAAIALAINWAIYIFEVLTMPRPVL